jgi:hypothetical protein
MEVQIPVESFRAALKEDLDNIKDIGIKLADTTERTKAGFDEIAKDIVTLTAAVEAKTSGGGGGGEVDANAIADAIIKEAKASGVSIGAALATLTKKGRATKLEKACADLIPPGSTFLCLLFEGGKGSGKTFQLVRWLMNVYGKANVFRTDCDSTLRTPDMRGHPCPEGDGTSALGWLDKTASSVFRHISKNRVPTAWMLDELLALREDTMNSFKSMLSPTDYDTGDGLEPHYRLETGKPIGATGHKTSEVIYIPVRLLAIAGTTNRGSRYFINEMDEAMESRWRIVPIECTEGDIAKIFAIKCAEHQARYKLDWTNLEVEMMCHFAKRFFVHALKASRKNELKTYPSNREFSNLLNPCTREPRDFLVAFESKASNHLYDAHRYCSKDGHGTPIKQHVNNLKNVLKAVKEECVAKADGLGLDAMAAADWKDALSRVG